MVICTKIRVHKIQVSITILSMRNITLTCVYMYMHVVELVQPVYIVIYDIHNRWCTVMIQPQYQFSFLLPPPPAITSDLAVVPFWWTPFSVGFTLVSSSVCEQPLASLIVVVLLHGQNFEIRGWINLWNTHRRTGITIHGTQTILMYV